MVNFGVMLIGGSLLLAIFAFSIYMVFFPLARTLVGGVQVLTMVRPGRVGLLRREKSLTHLSIDPELGLTMADGGERTENKEAAGAKK
jgi:hypothetical protein